MTTYDTPYTPTIADHLEIECDEAKAASAEREERLALDAMADELASSGIRRVEALLDGEMTRRVLLLTPERLREMSAVERRTMHAWIERRMKVLDEKSALLARHLLAVPERLRAVV